MGRINKNATTYLNHIDSQHDVERVPTSSSNSDLNTNIFNDIEKLRKKSLTVPKNMIIQLGRKNQTEKHPLNNCKILNNWLENFKTIYDIKRRNLSGNSASNDENAALNLIKEYNKINESYDPEDIFNAYETAFYLKLESKFLYTIPDSYTKKKKNSASFFLVRHKERNNPLFIGKSKTQDA